MTIAYHIPVLVGRVVESVNAASALTVVDATLGDAGYTMALLREMPGEGRVIAIDQDTMAIARAQERLGSLKTRVTIVQENFGNLSTILKNLNVDKVNAVVADLGVSRLQISDPERGFMYMQNGPLRMTMNVQSGYDAEQLVNDGEREELITILREYGEERLARRIVDALIRRRQKERIVTTEQFRTVIQSVVGRKFEIKSFARCFQAIRIAVNKELDSLQAFLPAAVDALVPGGRLVVVSYHSLEDRIVKQFMRKMADPCDCPKDLPVCVCGKTPVVKVTGKPVFADDKEIESNPSARSAVMRTSEKL